MSAQEAAVAECKATPGQWCDGCMTRSGVLIVVVTMSSTGAVRDERLRCPRCEGGDR